MQLTDILSKQEWMAFENEISDRFHINCMVYDTTGTGVIGQPHWCNRLCPPIKANKESLAAVCATANQYFTAQAEQTQKPVIGECDAGLIKIAVPIFAGSQFLGTVGGCGRLPEGGEVETFLIQKLLGLKEDEIIALCDGLQPMSEAEAEKLTAFIANRISAVMDQRVSKNQTPEKC